MQHHHNVTDEEAAELANQQVSAEEQAEMEWQHYVHGLNHVLVTKFGAYPTHIRRETRRDTRNCIAWAVDPEGDPRGRSMLPANIAQLENDYAPFGYFKVPTTDNHQCQDGDVLIRVKSGQIKHAERVMNIAEEMCASKLNSDDVVIDHHLHYFDSRGGVQKYGDVSYVFRYDQEQFDDWKKTWVETKSGRKVRQGNTFKSNTGSNYDWSKFRKSATGTAKKRSSSSKSGGGGSSSSKTKSSSSSHGGGGSSSKSSKSSSLVDAMSGLLLSSKTSKSSSSSSKRKGGSKH